MRNPTAYSYWPHIYDVGKQFSPKPILLFLPISDQIWAQLFQTDTYDLNHINRENQTPVVRQIFSLNNSISQIDFLVTLNIFRFVVDLCSGPCDRLLLYRNVCKCFVILSTVFDDSQGVIFCLNKTCVDTKLDQQSFCPTVSTCTR